VVAFVSHPYSEPTAGSGSLEPLRHPLAALREALPARLALHARQQHEPLDEFVGLSSTAQDLRIRAQASNVLRGLVKAVPSILALSAPSAFCDPEGNLVLEWGLPDRRFGLLFEKDAARSGWYFASRAEAGGHVASGSLNVLELPQVIGWTLGLSG
jgi:hypothetical protein